MHLHRVLAAVRSRHRGGTDEGTDLDVGERDLADPHDIDIAGHMQFDVLAASRLDGEHVAIDGFDGAANARRRGRLLGDRVKRGGRDHHDGGKRANELVAIAGHGKKLCRQAQAFRQQCRRQGIRENPPPYALGMVFYTGKLFPKWSGNLFAGALRGSMLVRLTLNGNAVTSEERLLQNLNERIRDVRQGPDGALWLLTDSSAGRILRVAPVAK